MIFACRAGLSRVSPHHEGTPVLPVDAAELGDDARALDALATLALTARRCGYGVVVRHASPRLVELIELAGLSEALPLDPLRPGSTPSRC
jgi:hypothetical protein